MLMPIWRRGIIEDVPPGFGENDFEYYPGWRAASQDGLTKLSEEWMLWRDDPRLTGEIGTKFINTIE